MIGGIIVGPEEAPNGSILLRGIGPSLSDFGIANPLADPMLELRDGNGALSDGERQLEIDPAGGDRSHRTRSQPMTTSQQFSPPSLPGIYTAIMRGTGDTTGIGLVEAYHLE